MFLWIVFVFTIALSCEQCALIPSVSVWFCSGFQQLKVLQSGLPAVAQTEAEACKRLIDAFDAWFAANHASQSGDTTHLVSSFGYPDQKPTKSQKHKISGSPRNWSCFLDMPAHWFTFAQLYLPF